MKGFKKNTFLGVLFITLQTNIVYTAIDGHGILVSNACYSATPRFRGLCPTFVGLITLLLPLLEHETVELGVTTPAPAGSTFQTDFSTVLEARVDEGALVEPAELPRCDVGVFPAESLRVLLYHRDELIQAEPVEFQSIAQRIFVIRHHDLCGAVDYPLERIPARNDGEKLLTFHSRVDVGDFAAGMLGNLNDHD